jgi:hypothetical protein
MIKKLLVLLFLLPVLSFAQEDSDYTICDCCTYSMFQYQNDYDEVFSPALIKLNKIKELTIYVSSERSENPKDTLKLIDREYREMIYKFNADGYVESQILFNRRGKYHSVYDFKRNKDNKIQYKTFHYLDSVGKKMVDFMPEKWAYTYNGDKLVKVKELDNKSLEQPDSKSNYKTYAYDSKGRTVKATWQSYYDEDNAPDSNESTIQYNEPLNESVSITKNNGKLFSTKKIKYNTGRKPLIEQYFNTDKKLLQEETYTYNSAGQLTRYKVKSPGMASECPDGNEFEDVYSYASIQLIDRVLHVYGNTVCTLRFVYK